MKKTALLLCLFFIMALSGVQAKSRGKVIYIFGTSISFVDSAVYVTGIQTLDSVVLQPKTDFLPHRQYYMYELKNYIEDTLKMPNRTCMVFYSKSKKKLEKKYKKVLKKLSNNNQAVVVKIGDEFQFVKPQFE